MKRLFAILIMVGLALGVFGTFISVVEASSLPCYDVWKACVDKHGYVEKCDILFDLCLDIMYPNA